MFIGRTCGISGKRRTVINLLEVVGLPLDTVLVDFATRNLKRAIIDDKLNVGEVSVIVRELFATQLHVVGTDRSALGSGVTGEFNVVLDIELVTGLKLIAGHRLLVAVIRLGVLVACNGHGNLIGDGAN